jgi:hypothetical protein
MDLARGLVPAAAYAVSYSVWVLGFRLVVLTLITYALMSSNSRFQDISDAFAANELVLVGLGSLIFVVFLRLLNPMTSISTDEIFTSHRFERRFAPGFLSGAVLASGVVLAFLMSGLYRYLGFFVQFEEAPLAVANVGLRVLTLGCLAYCEEFVFRHKLMGMLRSRMPDVWAAVAIALLYCGVKALQFDLGLMHLISLFLLSLALSVRTVVDGDFARGAGFWTGLLVVFHTLLSLPVFGNEFQGVLLIRYQNLIEGESGTARFLTGGAGGPLSSFALQLIFVLDIAQGIYKNKKLFIRKGWT